MNDSQTLAESGNKKDYCESEHVSGIYHSTDIKPNGMAIDFQAAVERAVGKKIDELAGGL